jgi:hypothetical protein
MYWVTTSPTCPMCRGNATMLHHYESDGSFRTVRVSAQAQNQHLDVPGRALRSGDPFVGDVLADVINLLPTLAQQTETLNAAYESLSLGLDNMSEERQQEVIDSRLAALNNTLQQTQLEYNHMIRVLERAYLALDDHERRISRALQVGGDAQRQTDHRMVNRRGSDDIVRPNRTPMAVNRSIAATIIGGSPNGGRDIPHDQGLDNS